MFRILLTACLISVCSMLLGAQSAEAQRLKRSCHCDVTCKLPNGSTDKSLSYNWNDIYKWPYRKSQLDDCKQKCATRISNINVQSLANSKGKCGTTVCTAEWSVGLGKGRRSGSAGTTSATHDGPECHDDKCCVPAKSELLQKAFHAQFQSDAASNISWTYVGNSQLNDIYYSALQMEHAINGAQTTYLVVKFSLYESPTSTGPAVLQSDGYAVYGANSGSTPWVIPSTFFPTPLVNGKYYEIRTELTFWRKGTFFSKDCDTASITLDRTATSRAKLSSRLGVGGSEATIAVDPNAQMPESAYRKFDKTSPEISEDFRNYLEQEFDLDLSVIDAPKSEWTEWLNFDRPGGNGDYQTIAMAKARNIACEAPSAIECRRSSDKVAASETGEIITCDTQTGLACVNKQQPDGRCMDYEVRFSCPAK